MTIGSPCNEDAACNVEGGICNQSERKCICKPGMVAAFNERKCLNGELLKHSHVDLIKLVFFKYYF